MALLHAKLTREFWHSFGAIRMAAIRHTVTGNIRIHRSREKHKRSEQDFSIFLHRILFIESIHIFHQMYVSSSIFLVCWLKVIKKYRLFCVRLFNDKERIRTNKGFSVFKSKLYSVSSWINRVGGSRVRESQQPITEYKRKRQYEQQITIQNIVSYHLAISHHVHKVLHLCHEPFIHQAVLVEIPV